MNSNFFGKNNFIMIILILFCFMVAGTFFDYQLSTAMYNQASLFGQILAAYGQFPVSLVMSVSGIMLIRLYRKPVQIVLGILLNLMALFMSTYEPMMYMGMPMPISFVINVILLVSGNYILYKICGDCSSEDLKKGLKMMLFVIFVQIIIINIVKVPWGRPRMRMIVDTPEAYFQPWYVIGSKMKDALIPLGVAAEEFKSFPSGHTACAACSFLLLLIPVLNTKYEDKKNVIFWCAALFTAIVAFSRIIMGAHFLTDITVGWFVTMMILMIGNKIFMRRG